MIQSAVGGKAATQVQEGGKAFDLTVRWPERLRADAATRGVGVLMVTALDQPADVDRAVAVGTDDFITKPINKTELLIRVRALLDARGQRTELDRALAYMGRVQAGV